MKFEYEIGMSTIKETLDKLANPYVFHNEITDDDHVDSVRTVPKDHMILAYRDSRVTLSDMFIVLAIVKLNIGTKSSIEAFLQWYKKLYPKKSVISPNMFSTRINNLLKNGIVYRFKYRVIDKDSPTGYRSTSYYTVSPSGYQFLKNVLYYNDGYNEFASVLPMHKVIQQIGVVAILQHMLHHGEVSNFSCNDFRYVRNKGNHRIFAKAKTKHEGKDYNVIIEPFHLKYDELWSDKGSVLAEIKLRMKMLTDYVSELQGKGNKVVVIFSCEDIASIELVMNYVITNSISLVDYCYFTTPALCHVHGFSNSMLRIAEITTDMKLGGITNEVLEPFC